MVITGHHLGVVVTPVRCFDLVDTRCEIIDTDPSRWFSCHPPGSVIVST